MHNAKSRAAMLLLALLLAFFPPSQASASYSSLYAFGDGVCTTTDNASGSSLYYQKRYCNGRVWIEVLSNWQGLAYDESKNKSFYGHDSVKLLTSISNFPAPADAATALFVVWCNDADFVLFASSNPPPYSSSNIPTWNSFISQAVGRHSQAVTNLYNKGARAIIMPTAVNIAKTPYFGMGTSDSNFIRDRTIAFNSSFDAAMASLEASLSGLKIYRPDTFSFFEYVLANPSEYGLTNPTTDAIDALGNPNKETGAGVSYVFWDDLNPTAKFQMYLADLVQRMISPPKVNSVGISAGTVQMEIANIPLGRAGVVQGSASLQPPWSQDGTFTEPFVAGGSTTKTVSFPCSGASRFYRVGFPVVWTWP